MFTSVRWDAPQPVATTSGRRIVLMDIENLVGGAIKNPAEAAWAQSQLREVIGLANHDQVVIGTCHLGLLSIYVGWDGAPRFEVRSGEDGADLALLEVLTGENLESRYDEVVLVSGDGIFTEAVAALAAAGVRVTVVYRTKSCSRRLRLAAGRSILLDAEFAQLGGAA